MSQKDLIPAKKGDIRNPKGKPKGTKNWSTIFKKYANLKLVPAQIGKNGIDMPTEGLKNKKMQARDIIAIRLIMKAMAKADARDIELLINRMDGLLTQQMKLSGEVKNTNIQEMAPEQLKLLENDLKGILNKKLKNKK